MTTTTKDKTSSEITELQKPLAGRRVLSWLFFLVLLIATLVLPVATNLWPSLLHNQVQRQQVDQAVQSTTASFTPSKVARLDVMWNPGELSSSHGPWLADCTVCHQQPFVQVKDADCLACHKTVGTHVKSTALRIAALDDVRCTSCHREHKGQFGLLEQNTLFARQQCSACHSHIKDVYPETKTDNVADFALDHPAFRVQLVTSVKPLTMSRQRQTADTGTETLTEKTGLKFPHDAHLVVHGVDSPDGKKVLQCASCHAPNADGSGFLPVTMKDHCQQCHALRFELAVPSREVPHGSVDQVLSTLREFYSYVSVFGVPVDDKPLIKPITVIRPGQTAPVQTFVKGAGDIHTRAVAASVELFEKTSCVVCHEVKRVAHATQRGSSDNVLRDMPFWEIAPVAPRHAFMPESSFNHSKHHAINCNECHAASHSKLASDVLMPTITECRQCHVGQQPVANKVQSTCAMCHGFHSLADHPLQPSMVTNVASKFGEDKIHAPTH